MSAAAQIAAVALLRLINDILPPAARSLPSKSVHAKPLTRISYTVSFISSFREQCCRISTIALRHSKPGFALYKPARACSDEPSGHRRRLRR